MAKRVGVILAGCGRHDGSDVAEAMLTLLVVERAGAEAVCAAPDVEMPTVFDHLSVTPATGTRNARVEAARIAGNRVLPLAELTADRIDALIVPGGEGAVTTLSDYAAKHELCQIHPDLSRLLRAMLAGHRPMGFVGLSALLAARVLGPVAGVRVTLGSKGTQATKHAAVMGADVRPCLAEDVIVDQKSRVFTTPGFLFPDTRLATVARAMDRLVRAVVGAAKDRSPSPNPAAGKPIDGNPVAAKPVVGQPVATKPVVGQPVAAKPAVGQPVVRKPGAGKPTAPAAPTGRGRGSA